MTMTEINAEITFTPGGTLYWIGTPRHFLIAAGLALENGESDSDLLLTSLLDLTPHFDRIANVIQASLENWEASPFTNVNIVRHPARNRAPSSRMGSIMNSLREQRQFRRLARRTELREVRMFNATSWRTQVFLYEIKRRFPRTRRVIIEDGGIFYNSQTIGDVKDSSLWKWKSLARRLIYGRAWTDVLDARQNGRLDKIVEEIQMIAPELAREELSSVVRTKLSAEPLRRLADTELPRIYLEATGHSVSEFQDIDLCVILARTDSLIGEMSAYVQTVLNLLRAAAESGMKVAVKYHPKEPERDYMNLAEETWITELPREIPAELLFVINRDNLKFVLGDASSALLSAPWINPDCRTISFASMVDKRPDTIFPNFGGFGIQSVNSLDEFNHILEECLSRGDI